MGRVYSILLRKSRNQINMTDKSQLNAHYIKALIETIRGPFLILDSALRVVEANETFYQAFKATIAQTKKKLVYELGNGQWNIPALKQLLEEVLPANKIVKDYEVIHNFPDIGVKIMLLNANQVDSAQLIFLSFEDITADRGLEKKLGEYTKSLEIKVVERTKQLAARVKELEELKNKP